VRVLFYSAAVDPTGDGGYTVSAPGHYRMEMPCFALQHLGHHQAALVPWLDTLPGSGRFIGATIEKRVVPDAEIVVLQALVGADAIRAARRSGQVVVVDLTDVWVLPEQHVERAALQDLIPRMEAMVNAATAITVSSDFLRNWIRQRLPECPPIHVVRNAIYLDEWQAQKRIPTATTVLGWNGSLGERADDFAVMRPWLGDFLERHDLKFVHVGGKAGEPLFAEMAGIDPARLEIRPARSLADFRTTQPLAGVDLQLVPLTGQHVYSRAKSALKGLESAAMGVPFVASPHDEYQRLGFGRLAGTDLDRQEPRDWIAAVEPLLDPAERAKVADEARAAVAAQDIRVRWHDWETVYGDLLGSTWSP